MSYDIRYGVKSLKYNRHGERMAVVGRPEYDSPTYNLGKMFRVATGWDFEQGKWYRIEDVEPNISDGLRALMLHREMYRKYEPENGWGTVESAIKVLKGLLSDIEYFKGSACEYSGDVYEASQFNYEDIWIRW